MSKESNLELKVGIFVLLALAALTFFIFSITDFSVFQEVKSLKVVFSFANGLKKSSPVRFAGVDAGKVNDIKVIYDPQEKKMKVQVELWLAGHVQVPSDSKVLINQLGLLGEKYIEILPGKNREQILPAGAVLTGKDPVPMEELSEKFNTVAMKLEEGLDGLNAIVASKTNQASIENTLSGISLIVDNVREGRGTVGKLLYDESIFDNLESFSEDVKQNPWKLLYKPKEKKKLP